MIYMRLSRNSDNVVVFPFAFYIAIQQPFKPLWSRLLLYELEPSRAAFALCFKSLLMSLLPASDLVYLWRLPFEHSSKGGPASSYATAGIAPRVTCALKPPHHDKVEHQRGREPLHPTENKALPKHYQFVPRILLGWPGQSRNIILTKRPNRICWFSHVQSTQENNFLSYILCRPRSGVGIGRRNREKPVSSGQTFTLVTKESRVLGSRLQ
jgi:hypothetical protein